MRIEAPIEAKREEILQIATKHKAYNARVFGSVARGKLQRTAISIC